MKKNIVLMLVLLVSSCWKKPVYLLDEKELSWTPGYEQGDTLLFRSGAMIDTMLVEETGVYNSADQLDNPEDERARFANVFSWSVMKHQDRTFMTMFCLTKRDETISTIELSLNERYRSASLAELHLQQKTIDGAAYDDVLVVDASNTDPVDASDPFNCEYFLWSKSKGLLQYRYLNGDIYTFYKKLPHKE